MQEGLGAFAGSLSQGWAHLFTTIALPNTRQMKNEKLTDDILASQLAAQLMPAHADLCSPDESSTASAPARPAALAKGYSGATRIPAIITDALFVFLIIVNVIRTLRHAMWRDELQVFMLAIYSSSPWSLLSKLRRCKWGQ